MLPGILLQPQTEASPDILIDYPSAIEWRPSSSFKNRLSYMTGQNYADVTFAVIRTEEGAIGHILGLFTSNEASTCPHLTIAKDGTIYQHVALSKQAINLPECIERGGHLNQNLYSIGIVLENKGDGTDSFPEAQTKALHDLLKYINSSDVAVNLDNKGRMRIELVKWKTSNPAYSDIPATKRFPIGMFEDLDIVEDTYEKTYTEELLKARISKDQALQDLGQKVFWYGSPNFRPRKAETRIDTIHLHPAGETLPSTVTQYSDSNWVVSSHFTIDQDGSILQHGHTSKRGYRTGVSFDNQNRPLIFETSISIGLVRDKESGYSEEQAMALRQLGEQLIKAYPTISQITRSVPPNQEADPYERFPFEVLKDLRIDVHRGNEELVRKMLTQDPIMGEYARWIYSIPASHSEPRPAEYPTPDTIVLHHTACSFDQTIMGAHLPFTQVAAHFTIDKDGTTAQHVPTSDCAYHAGVSEDQFGREKVNHFSIGIELVNSGSGEEPYPSEQTEALKSLLRHLLKMYPKTKQITTHEYVARPKGRKDDPKGFPWETLDEFKNLLIYNPD